MAKKGKKRVQNKPLITQATSKPVASKVETERSAVESKSKVKRFTQWCLGTIFGLLLLAIIGNHISAVIPNPFQFVVNQFPQSQKPIVWYATSIKNSIKHEISVGVWSNTQTTFVVYTLQPEETKWFSEDAPIYMTIQGDMVAQQIPLVRVSHTYEGEEAYELIATTFDRQPSDDELKSVKPNNIIEIIGGPEPKIVSFVDGTEISFDVFGPRNEELNVILPIIAEGKYFYPFQVQNSKK